MGFWHDMKIRLGLADDWQDDDYYEDDEYYDAEAPEEEPPARRAYAADRDAPVVRRLDRDGDYERRGEPAGLRSVPAGPASVTPAAPKVNMYIVEPKSFTEAQSIADKFKKGTPVIMNMSMTSPELAKRMIDFASGLTYGLDGGLQKVSEKVFMLTPHNVQVSEADRLRLKDRGLFTVD